MISIEWYLSWAPAAHYCNVNLISVYKNVDRTLQLSMHIFWLVSWQIHSYSNSAMHPGPLYFCISFYKQSLLFTYMHYYNVELWFSSNLHLSAFYTRCNLVAIDFCNFYLLWRVHRFWFFLPTIGAFCVFLWSWWVNCELSTSCQLDFLSKESTHFFPVTNDIAYTMNCWQIQMLWY